MCYKYLLLSTDKRKKPEVVDTEIKDNYPTDDVLYKDESDEEDTTMELEGDTEDQTDFEIATKKKFRSVSVNATVKTEEKETQYEVFVPKFTLGFDEISQDSLDLAMVQAIKNNCCDAFTQTAEFGNTYDNPIVID